MMGACVGVVRPSVRPSALSPLPPGSYATLFESVTSLDDWPPGSQGGKNLQGLFGSEAYSVPTVIVDDNKRNVWRHQLDVQRA